MSITPGNFNSDEPPATPQMAELEKMLAGLSTGLEKLVVETMQSLEERGIDAGELTPLMKLRQAVRALDPGAAAAPQTPPPASSAAAADGSPFEAPNGDRHYTPDGRRGLVEASTNLLARASAVIDIMVKGGQTPEHAAQVVTRQLLGVGIKLPESGGDARAWKRLFNWRNSLIHYKRSGQAWDAYCDFKEQLAIIPPEQRLRRAVGDHLWDLRQQEMANQESA